MIFLVSRKMFLSSVLCIFVWLLIGSVHGEPGLPTSDTSDPTVQRFLTRQINRFRRNVDATDMLTMSWDPEARSLAQKLTDRCQFRHPIGALEQATFLRTKKYSCGLNMARGTGQLGWNETLQLWLEGRKNFQFGVDTQKLVGQYTAMIWAKSHSFGCGFTQCKKGTPAAFDFFACNFCPAGNLQANLLKPYEQGERCGRCPKACDDGLCNNFCPETNVFSNCDTELFPSGCDGTPSNSPLAPFQDQCKATCQCKGKGLIF